jgi:hypothetical protein
VDQVVGELAVQDGGGAQLVGIGFVAGRGADDERQAVLDGDLGILREAIV